MVSDRDASFTWVSDNFLVREKVAPWGEMPLWMPEEEAPHLKGFMFIKCDKAVGSGLSFRPLRDTIKDTLTWWKTVRVNEEMKAGLHPDKEQMLLRKWHGAQ